MKLPNDTKIKFCNAFTEVKRHAIGCDECADYLRAGDGDLCEACKQIILLEMAYADTSPVLPEFPGELFEKAYVAWKSQCDGMRKAT